MLALISGVLLMRAASSNTCNQLAADRYLLQLARLNSTLHVHLANQSSVDLLLVVQGPDMNLIS